MPRSAKLLEDREHTLAKHVSANQGALSTIRHESMPLVHALFILSGIGRIL
jgi:hypothetical protein